MKSDLFSVLSRDLNELFNDPEEKNVVIQIGDEINRKEYKLHRNKSSHKEENVHDNSVYKNKSKDETGPVMVFGKTTKSE